MTRAKSTSPEATTAGKAMATTDTTEPADKKEIGNSTGSPAAIPTTMGEIETIGEVVQRKAQDEAIPCGPDMETGTELDLRIATTIATGMNMAATSAAPGAA
jgi:hypothetical protein